MANLIYSKTHKIRFSDISDKYKVSRTCKGRLSELHASIITYVTGDFQNTKKYKQQVVDALNIITYAVISGEPLPLTWSPKNPFKGVPEIDEDILADTLGELLLTVEGIEWNLEPTNNVVDIFPLPDDAVPSVDEVKPVEIVKEQITSEPKKITKPNSGASVTSVTALNHSSEVAVVETPKQDLYIQPPKFPQFDITKPWIQGQDTYNNLVIYTTLPEVPTRQSEISVTTDVTKLTRAEKLRLYPNNVIHTRAPIMYEPTPGIELDPKLGLLLPIQRFTRDQIIDNIIRYPHFYKLARCLDNEMYSFYSHIEIDGELHGTLDIWNELPEAKTIPRQAEFVKEYVVRRYLLERDILHIDHKYKIYGSLEEFLTLFMPSNDYISYGYTDIEKLATKCVVSRVKYKQSRNPVLRRLNA